MFHNLKRYKYNTFTDRVGGGGGQKCIGFGDICLYFQTIYFWESEASPKIFEINTDDKKKPSSDKYF